MRTLATLCCLWLPLWLSALSAQDSETPASSEQHFEVGVRLFDGGEVEQALSRFEKAKLESGEPRRVDYNIGHCHWRLKEVDLAEAAFLRVTDAEGDLLDLRARYNLGCMFHEQGLKPSTDGGEMQIDEALMRKSVFMYQDVIRLARRPSVRGQSEVQRLGADARYNVELIQARMKELTDRRSRERGGKHNALHGKVSVNGRPLAGAFIQLKSKWDEGQRAEVRSREGGSFEFNPLEVGKYLLAGSLHEAPAEDALSWTKPARVPSHKDEVQEVKLSGPLSLGCPYQASDPSLPAPYDDHLRLSGPQSLISSTDWGELTDGRPAHSFPASGDLDIGYVAFETPRFRIAMGLPAGGPEPAAVANTTEPSEPPRYKVVIKGMYDSQDRILPVSMNILGLPAEGQSPIPLLQCAVSSTEPGLYAFETEAFEQQQCRQLIFEFEGLEGKRIVLHEIEVHEQKAGDGQGQQPPPPEDPPQDKQKQEDPQPQEGEKPSEEQTSDPVQAMLDKIRQKNRDQEKSTGVGMRHKVDRDW